MIFWLCYDATHQDGRVCGVRLGNRWHRVSRVNVHVPTQTRYRATGHQPKAYLRGVTRHAFVTRDLIALR